MSKYPIFSVLGIEIEYMLVDAKSLEIQPKSDIILNLLAGQLVNEVELGEIAASNELVMHVLELKNNGPKPYHAPVAHHFQQTIFELQPILNDLGLKLLPTGAHPWMDPHLETQRWPHGSKEIYQQYDKIFGCHGHGWANLQSMHVNFPFANDTEFCELHNAIRLILPLIPSLAASTPFLDGKATGLLDTRLDFYGKNQQKIPSISGDIIPEFITSQAHYEQAILNPMYQAIHDFDPEKILQHEWLNSRGAIAKFAYQAIEIRIIDSQECVQADIAIAHVIHAILQYWHKNSTIYLDNQLTTKPLKLVYDKSIKAGLDVVVDDMTLLEQWQIPKRAMSLRQVWSTLIEKVSSELSQANQNTLEHILTHGNLSERILKACAPSYSRTKMKDVYHQLSDCLLENRPFIG